MDLRRIYQFIWHPGIWQHDRNNYIVTTNAQNNYILFEFCPSITNESWTDMHCHAESTQAPTCWHWASWRDSACGVGGQCCWTLSWRCEFCSPFIHTHSPVLELLLLYFSVKKKRFSMRSVLTHTGNRNRLYNLVDYFHIDKYYWKPELITWW